MRLGSLDPPNWPLAKIANAGYHGWKDRAMPTRNVNLTEHFDRMIDEGVKSGRFSNASEMVREGLRLLEQRDEEHRAHVEWLRGEVQKGIDDIESGAYSELRSEGELDEFLDRIGDRVVARYEAGAGKKQAS